MSEGFPESCEPFQQIMEPEKGGSEDPDLQLVDQTHR